MPLRIEMVLVVVLSGPCCAAGAEATIVAVTRALSDA
jgi:hypothetical protein